MVAGSNRMGVGGLDPLEPSQRGDQHQQGRARQMEIGQQQLDGAERWPSKMNNRVSPAKGLISSFSSAAVSRRRKLVVPTATMRRPASRIEIRQAASSGAIRVKGGLGWLRGCR